jgi:hypothetical protein
VPGVDETTLKALARDWPRTGLPIGAPGKGLLGRGRPHLEFHGCDLLSDEADWGAPTWAMTRDGIARLAEASLRLFERLSSPVVIQALWEGDEAETEESMTREDYLGILEAGALGTRTRYLVRP